MIRATARLLSRLLIAVLAVSTAAAASAQDVKLPKIEFGRYHALVIGNNDYQYLRNLTTAVGDADAVATLLEDKYGFKVTKLINATRRDITGAFNRLRQALTEKDNLLVYYAGHGVLDEEASRGYWQPVDARPDDDSDWFSNTRLTGYLKAMSARHVMVIADSCYSGNLTRLATSTVRSGAERTAWMERMNEKRSRTALTSGGLEPVLDRGGGGHSVFARAFLTALEENPEVLFGEELFDRVKGVVVANADQTPEYSDIRYTGHEKGDFLFVPLDINVSVTVRTPAPTRSDREALFWRSIKDSKNPAKFQAYLRRYPDGDFVDLAKLEIEAAAKAKEQQTALVVPPKPAVELEPVEAEFVAVKNANVRAAPTVRSAKVATLKRGASVYVAGKVKGGNWYLVERDDEPLGYVLGNLLKSAEAMRQEEEMRRKAAERSKVEAARQRRQREDERRRAVEDQSRLEEARLIKEGHTCPPLYDPQRLKLCNPTDDTVKFILIRGCGETEDFSIPSGMQHWFTLCKGGSGVFWVLVTNGPQSSFTFTPGHNAFFVWRDNILYLERVP